MRKPVSKCLSLLLCVAVLLTVGACSKSKDVSSNPAGTSDDGILIGIDDVSKGSVSGSTATTTKPKPGTKTTYSEIKGDTGDYGGAKMPEQVDLNKSDPFANIPARLKGSTVKFATWGDESGETYRKVINAFTKKTGINVKCIEYSQGSYLESVTASIVNKDAPDVAICAFYPRGFSLFQPLNNLVNLEDDFWDPTMIKVSTVNGKTYALNSWESSWEPATMVYYNKAIFDNNGITSPDEYYKAGKWSWENYEKCAKEVANLHNGYVGTTPNAIALSQQLGNPVIKFDYTKAQLVSNVRNLTEGYRWALSLIESGASEGLDAWSAFALGKQGLIVTDPFGAKYNGYYKDMKDSELRMLPLPDSYKGQKLNQAVACGYRGYGIAKGAKNPEGAAYFIRYFLDYKYYREAKVNIFKNADLEKTYFETIAPIYKNNPNQIIDIYGDLVPKFGDEFNKKVLEGSSSQIDSIIEANANKVDSAVKEANEVLANLKK